MWCLRNVSSCVVWIVVFIVFVGIWLVVCGFVWVLLLFLFIIMVVSFFMWLICCCWVVWVFMMSFCGNGVFLYLGRRLSCRM